MKKPIGQSMVEARLITKDQLEDLLEYQKRQREKVIFGKLSLELGLISEDQFAPFIASYFDVPFINLKDHPIIVRREAINMIPESIARRLNVMPLTKDNNTLTVAVSDPLDLVALDNLAIVSHCNVKPVVSTPSQITHSITISYGIL